MDWQKAKPNDVVGLALLSSSAVWLCGCTEPPSYHLPATAAPTLSPSADFAATDEHPDGINVRLPRPASTLDPFIGPCTTLRFSDGHVDATEFEYDEHLMLRRTLWDDGNDGTVELETEFIYDPIGNLIRIDYYEGETDEPSEVVSFEWPFGAEDWTRREVWRADVMMAFEERVFDDDSGLLQLHFRDDHFGELETVYTYDEAGRTLNVRNTDDGRPSYDTWYLYRDDGSLRLRQTFLHTGGPLVIRYVYDTRERLVLEEHFTDGQQPHHTHRYTYDDRDLMLVKATEGLVDDVPDARTEQTWDTRGNLVMLERDTGLNGSIDYAEHHSYSCWRD